MTSLQVICSVLGILIFAIYLLSPSVAKFYAWATTPTAPPIASVKAGDTITAEQAMASVFLLSRYVATQKGAPEFDAVQAALKTLEPKA